MPETVTVPRTRARLEAAWATKSERPLAAGIYSVSMLAKMTAGAIARRILSKEPSDFPAYLGFSGNAMGDKLLDAAGVPESHREFNLWYRLDDVALSGHLDGVDVDHEARTVTVLEAKRHTFPTAASTEQAKRQGLAYAALFRMALLAAKSRGEDSVTFQYPAWHPVSAGGLAFPVELADYRFQVQVLIAGAFEGEIHDVPASPELLGEVLQEFYAKAMAVDVSAKAGTPDAADAFDLRVAKERPVTAWAEPPAEVEAAMRTLADAKFASDAAQAAEETARAAARDALRAANLTKAIGSGISASWVARKVTDMDAVVQFVTAAGKTMGDFMVERVVPAQTVRELDATALDIFIGVNGKQMDDFKTKTVSESFTVRAAGKKPAKAKEVGP